jgi:serine/threonine-protein kinase
MTNNAPLTNIGRYRIVSELGRGAMGIVYKARDAQLDRFVAIKTIRVSTEGDEAAEYLARFRQEAKALGALNHPGIITVFDAGSEDDFAYMAMELLDGVELRDLMAQARLPIPLILDLAAQIAEALAFAHERGVVHRDIKPANIMVVEGNRAKIMDFGIARVRISDVKTQTGVLLGSPKYMSPEQVLGRPVDRRSDIFSLGVVLYEMLAGAVPFSGADLTQLMFQVVNGAPPPPSRVNPAVPDVLDYIVAKALEKNPDKRYADAGEMAADLRSCRAEATAPMEMDVSVEATVPDSGGTIAGGATLAPASLGLPLSRHLDSTRALSRLEAPASSDRLLTSPTPPAGTPFQRLREDSHLLGAIAILGSATVIALTIAFV